MRYTDIRQVLKNYSIDCKETPFDYSLDAPTKIIVEDSKYTLNLTYTRFQQVEIDESLFSHFKRFEDQYWEVTISHPLYEYPNKRIVDAYIQEDNKKLKEYNKRKSNRCKCNRCIHYHGSWEKYIKCSGGLHHDFREKTTDGWNCSEYKEK